MRCRATARKPKPLYLEAIEHLGRIARRRAPCACRARVYGEWLRREQRRVDARVHLETPPTTHWRPWAPRGFAERARRELHGQRMRRSRRRTAETRDELTPQEAQIARMACGRALTNPEIGAQLFLSHRTGRVAHAPVAREGRRQLAQGAAAVLEHVPPELQPA